MLIKKLRLKLFKSFKDAEIDLGPFTVLVGANASGKSNLRDAFRFLHGISLNYNLADVFGGTWSGGVLQWSGIRGVTRITFQDSETFALEMTFFNRANSRGKPEEMLYRIEVAPGKKGITPRIVAESLRFPVSAKSLFAVKYRNDDSGELLSLEIDGRTISETEWRKSYLLLNNRSSSTGILFEIAYSISNSVPPIVWEACLNMRMEFRDLRFFNLEPDMMRMPSVPGQTKLGDREASP